MNRPRHLRGVVERGFVAGRVGATLYALPIEEVREIVLPAALAPLPGAPSAVIGAVDHRGEVLPVLDLGCCLGTGRTSGARRKWVLVRAHGRSLGLVFDQVQDVFRVAESEIRPAPEVGDLAARSATEVVAVGGELAFILDMRALAVFAELPPTAGGSA